MDREGTVRAGEAGDEVAERVGHRLEEGLRHPDRQRGAEGVAQARGILDGRPPVVAADPHGQDPTRRLELGQGRLDGRRLEALGRAGDDVTHRERAEDPEQVGDVLAVADPALRRQALELRLGAGHGLGVEQVTQRESLALAEQLRQQGRVERECGGTALGERRVALVEVLRDIAEDERLRERARLARLDVDDLDGPGADVAHELDEARHVEDVLDALAHGLEHDGEGRVLARDLEELGRALALLPQRLAAVGPTARQQERPGSALPEPRSEQGRSADLLRDELADLLGLQGDQLDELLADRGTW